MKETFEYHDIHLECLCDRCTKPRADDTLGRSAMTKETPRECRAKLTLHGSMITAGFASRNHFLWPLSLPMMG